MKKTLICIAALMAALAMAPGCKRNVQTDEPFAGMSTAEIVDKLYEALPATVELPRLSSTEITAENAAYYVGTDDVAFTEGTASEPLINAIAYSVCVLRLADAEDSADVQAKIKQNADPRKWICVGVEDSDVIVDGAGDVVILIMAEGSKTIHEAFLNIAGK